MSKHAVQKAKKSPANTKWVHTNTILRTPPPLNFWPETPLLSPTDTHEGAVIRLEIEEKLCPRDPKQAVCCPDSWAWKAIFNEQLPSRRVVQNRPKLRHGRQMGP